MSSAAADLNVPAQKLQTEQWSSQPSTSAPIRDRLSPQAAPRPPYNQRHLIKESSGQHLVDTLLEKKITEEETGNNPYCSAAPMGDPQASRV